MLTKKIYHCHTSYCGDCDVPMEDSVAKAISQGFKAIGFTVHTPWPNDKPSRISNANFQVYVEHVSRLKKLYKNKIEVLCGLEGEYSALHADYFKKLRNTPGVDFQNFGLHYLNVGVGKIIVSRPHSDPERIKRYADDWITAMKTGLFTYAAHPDYFFLGYGVWDEHTEKHSRRMIRFAVKHGYALGYDMKYRLARSFATGKGIPTAPFWRIAIELGAAIHVELDAHDLDWDWAQAITDGEQQLKALGCKQVVSAFDLKGDKHEYKEL